jgi:hypothetical protein
MKFHEKTSTHVKEFAVKRFIRFGCAFELIGAMESKGIVDEVLKTLRNVKESKHGVLGERPLCVLGCVIDVVKRVNGPAGFTKIMDCLKTSCGLKNAEHFYRYEEDLEESALVAPIKVSRGKNLYAPSIKGVFIYNVAAVLRLMEVDPQAFIQHAIVMLGFLRLLLETRKDVFDKLLSDDKNLMNFFMEAIDRTLDALTKGEDVSRTIALLTKHITTANGEVVTGFDLVEYLTSIVVNLYLTCTRGLIEYLNLNDFLKMGRMLEDLRNNEPTGSQG